MPAPPAASLIQGGGSYRGHKPEYPIPMSNQIPTALLDSAEATILWAKQNDKNRISDMIHVMEEEMAKRGIKEASDQYIVDALRRKAGKHSHTITAE